MSLDGMEAVCVTQECDSDGLCVKQECDSDGLCVKQECDSDGCGDNEAALAALYEDHVVKQELVLGPELLQKPSVVYTPPEEVKTEEEENQNTSHQDISSNADIREISSLKLPSSTKIDRLGAEQNTVYEFVTQSINDCKFCSDTFDTKLLLQEHEKSQHGVKYFTCSTFTENGNLKLELNTENKQYECKTTFATSSNLGEHLGTHTGENNEAALAALYEDHVVKQELVLGPELLQKPSVVYTPPASVRTPPEAVKPVQGWDSDGHSETEDHELNEELLDVDLELGPVVLKLELELDPVVLQPPDALYSRRGHIAKKTESSNTNKRKAPVEDKNDKPNEKIVKTNAAEINPETSAASQDLSSNTDVQEATPEKPAGSSSSSEVNTLTAETKFKCEKCGKCFNIKSDLEKHLNTHTLMKASTSHNTSKFTCKTCNCIFDTKLLLQEHEKSRHGVKYLACAECEYTTTRASDLSAHLRTHTGEKPFKCDWCKSAFTHRHYLRAHLRAHTGEKPFKCRQCNSTFTQSSNLQRHLRTHTGEKPFECNICDYKTIQSGHLKAHLMSRHSGQKPFACDACSYRGATSRHLRQHMKRHCKPA